MVVSKKILHITPHFGGGVGNVILNYLERVKNDPHFRHRVISLEYANDRAILASRTVGFSLMEKMAFDHAKIIKEIADADIILMHWWNHPLLYDFLVRAKLPPCRLIIWSHISGFHPPMVFTRKILQYPNLFVFTTPVSFETKEIKNFSEKQKKSLRVVWSTGGVEDFKSVKSKKHRGFHVGYVGSVDYVKLHPKFLNICNKINIPDVKFIVCGGPNEKEVKKEAERLGIADKFMFTGLVSDVPKQLGLFDVFGYPLSPHHYGTCDHSLQESMAAGVVPVVFANRMEKHMVKNGVTGIIVKDEKGYIQAVRKLYKNKTLRDFLSRNARQYAVKTYSLDKLVQDWKAAFDRLLAIPKNSKKWQITKTGKEIDAKDVFLESLGGHGEPFIDYCNSKSEVDKTKAMKRIVKLNESTAWRPKTRGTVHHYHSVFSDDKLLAFWSGLMLDNKWITAPQAARYLSLD